MPDDDKQGRDNQDRILEELLAAGDRDALECLAR